MKEFKVFGTTMKGREENIESTQVHPAAGRNKVEQNVKKERYIFNIVKMYLSELFYICLEINLFQDINQITPVIGLG